VTNPYQPPSSFEEMDRAQPNRHIQSLANKSLLFGILGLVCCGIIFGPLAINYANQAEAAIILDESGAVHGSTHKIGRGLGYAAIVLFVLGIVARLVGLLG
jgi:hypothetical protein